MKPPTCLASVLLLGALCQAQDGSLPLSATADHHEQRVVVKALPGAIAGSERWIVHFKIRPFDLEELTAEYHGPRDTTRIRAIVAKLEAAMLAHQKPFVAAVAALGGRVVMQYWLVNAAVIEIAPAKLAAVAKLENVASLEPDVEVSPQILTATNSNNHDADSLQAQNHTGVGVAAGVIDTGQDINMNGTNRPHVTYSRRGTTATRLVTNVQLGTQPADDVHGHGTGVASIVAGWKWNSATADHGHAYDANICGYAIANSTSGSSSTSVMAAAYQRITGSDAATYNIVATNLSYSGSRSPTSVEQQAADQMCLTADVLPCTAAGNSGTSTSSSQLNLNGLSVGACNENSKTIATFSSRGMINGNMAFPDICANGVSTNMARRNSETTDYVGSGTSMASPQVCGAATQLRARYTSLKADETKAILLASTLASPGTGANQVSTGAGCGYLHNPSAHAIAGNSKRHGRASVTTSTGFQGTMVLTANQTYQAAIAWSRLNVSSSSWSNLELRIKRGSTVVASSTVPTSTIEFVRFTPTQSGVYTFEVTASSIIGASSQPFAWATTFDTTTGSFTPGSYTLYGVGCKGSGQGGPGGVCVSANATATQNTAVGWATAWFAHKVTAPSALAVTGFEFLLNSSTATSLNCRVYDSDGPGGAPGTILANGLTMNVGATSAWYRASWTTPLLIPANKVFFIAFYNPGGVNAEVSSGSPTCYWWYGSWNQEWCHRAFAWKVLCQAQSGAIPKLSNTGVPELGKSFNIDLSLAKANTAAILWLGFSQAAVPLPAALAPGCTLYATFESFPFAVRPTNGAGDATVVTPIPNIASLKGAQFYNEWAILDGANVLGVVFTNGGAAKIGG